MNYFFILTMQFLKDGHLFTETHPDYIDSVPGDKADDLFWRAYRLFAERYRCDSFGDVLHWSITPNELEKPVKVCPFGNCKNFARNDTGYCDGHSR